MQDMYTIVICIALLLKIATCNADDPIKDSLLSWYDEWMDGFDVDYITTKELRDSYDFIVIGAGIGGSVTAHRLAMDESHPTVLLLEAGNKADTSALSEQIMPIRVQENLLTNNDWNYSSEASDGYCCKWHKDRKHLMSRGKVVGGSSVLNYMFWLRGHKEDWDKIINIDGWKWKDVLPYFEKIESLQTMYSDDTHRGHNGPVIINSARDLIAERSIFEKSIIDAFNSVTNLSFLENGQNSITGNNNGIAFSELNVDNNGLRNNAFIAYNKYLKNTYPEEYENGRINLDILPNAYVTKIIFGDSFYKDLIATSVQFADLSDNNSEYEIGLTSVKEGEIILSGGTINNPQLLMLSGIGPKDELIKHNINVLSDLSGVGKNLQDHIMTLSRYYWKQEYHNTQVLTANAVMNILSNFSLFREYLFEGKGLLSTVGCQLNALIRSNTLSNLKNEENNTYPDLQFYFFPGFNGVTKYFNYKDDSYIDNQCGEKEWWNDIDNMMNIFVAIGNMHPISKGYIKLKSDNPFDHPLIQPNYLKEQFDVDVLIEGYKLGRKIMNHPSAKKLWSETFDCKKYGDIENDDKKLEEFIRDSIVNIYHPIGTCKMGDIVNDINAVVDNQLKLKGVKNLRIIDASIFPSLHSGNTQLPTFMVAEKGADIILNIWNRKYETNKETHYGTGCPYH